MYYTSLVCKCQFYYTIYFCYDTDMTNSLAVAARNIIDASLYLVLATVTEDGRPWNSPVYFCHDDRFNLYWASAIESQHSKNLECSPAIFLVFFDSSTGWGKGRGVYMSATAHLVEDRDEVERVRKLRMQKVSQADQPIDDFTGNSPRRIYQATPKQIWMNGDQMVDGVMIDTREDITLEALVATVSLERI